MPNFNAYQRLWFRSAAVLCVAIGACTLPTLRPLSQLSGPRTDRDERPSRTEQYCAWFGDQSGSVLYFGLSPFWSAYRQAGGNPQADLQENGPFQIGRYDLDRLEFLPPLEIAADGSPTGSWDVLAHPNGRIYFSSLFDYSGWIDPRSGKTERFVNAGRGLNELTLGPDGSVLASRYGLDGQPSSSGSIVILDEAGTIQKELSLTAPTGYKAAPKTVAYDPMQKRIWVVTDMIPVANPKPSVGGLGQFHDTRLVSLAGRELRRIRSPEIQFVRFTEDGTGYLAEREGSQLWIHILPPGTNMSSGSPFRRIGKRFRLSNDFPSLDFVQDITFSEERIVLTRWSGKVHIVEKNDRHWHRALPRIDPDGLYYTGVFHRNRLCATYCSNVAVTCVPAPPPEASP